MKQSDEPLTQCLALRNDYLECLHHKKEIERKVAIAEAKEIAASGGGAHGGGHDHGGGGGH